MGQQQLFIIVIATLIAWEVIWGSMRYFDSVNQGNERELLTTQMRALITDALQYQMKPTTMGGGNGSFVGFLPPKNKSITERFRIYTGTTEREVIMSGFGNLVGNDESSPIHVILTYSSENKKVAVEIVN